MFKGKGTPLCLKEPPGFYFLISINSPPPKKTKKKKKNCPTGTLGVYFLYSSYSVILTTTQKKKKNRPTGAVPPTLLLLPNIPPLYIYTGPALHKKQTNTIHYTYHTPPD